jgi:hypothetical protein
MAGGMIHNHPQSSSPIAEIENLENAQPTPAATAATR